MSEDIILKNIEILKHIYPEVKDSMDAKSKEKVFREVMRVLETLKIEEYKQEKERWLYAQIGDIK